MNTDTQIEKIKGYKVTNFDFRCRDLQYELNKHFIHSGSLIGLCDSGFHFCLIANNCFNYYGFNTENRVFEVEAWGNVIHGEDKSVADNIMFIKELQWHEVLNLVNQGTGNTGRGNAGNYNAGNDNAGNYNAGNYNAGNYNAGNDNTGNRNTGNRNAGNYNAGNYNAGNDNAGNYNAGNDNAGNYNAGNDNAGNYNAGNRNAGYANAGNDNAGYANAGNDNAGYANAGNYNAGNYNAGNRNAGYANAGNDNAGNFNTKEAPYIMFNKPSKWSFEDFSRSNAFNLLNNVNTTLWVPSSVMTDEEKQQHPYHATTSGYVKHIPFKEAFQNAWHNWNEGNRNEFINLPNFNAKVFEEITGVKVK